MTRNMDYPASREMHYPWEELYERGRVIPVLIWCKTCVRYISNEDAHRFCPMTPEERKVRDLQRRVKVSEERSRVAA